jgi:hypothetical protein
MITYHIFALGHSSLNSIYTFYHLGCNFNNARMRILKAPALDRGCRSRTIYLMYNKVAMKIPPAIRLN